MNQIDNLTESANQMTQVILDDGSVLSLTFVFRAATERWTVDVSHVDLVVSGINLCVHPNLLREWRNLIPFGLSCTTVNGQDPTDVQAFSSGRAAIYVLDASEVIAVETNVFGGLLQ